MNKYVTAILIILLAAIAVGLLAMPHRTQNITVKSELFSKELDEIYAEARNLSSTGKHRQAAFMMIDLAGWQRVTSKRDDGRRENADEPSILEMAALFEFRLSSLEEGETYKSFLKIRYPSWQPVNDGDELH